MDIENIKWTCPECGHKNIDSYIDTAMPSCEWAGDVDKNGNVICTRQDLFWDDILTPLEMGEANKIMAAMQSAA